MKKTSPLARPVAAVLVAGFVAGAAVLGTGSAATAAGAVPDSGPEFGGTAVTLPAPEGMRFAQVHADSSFALGVSTDGKLYAWSGNHAGQLGAGGTATFTLTGGRLGSDTNTNSNSRAAQHETGTGSGSPLLFVIAGGGALLLVGAVAVWACIRARRRNSARDKTMRTYL